MVDYYADYIEQRMIEKKLLDSNKHVVQSLSYMEESTKPIVQLLRKHHNDLKPKNQEMYFCCKCQNVYMQQPKELPITTVVFCSKIEMY